MQNDKSNARQPTGGFHATATRVEIGAKTGPTTTDPTSPLPQLECSCTALYYSDDCPIHGRMYRRHKQNRLP